MFQIGNKQVNVDLIACLSLISAETNRGLFKDKQKKGKNILTNCPIHKGGCERHPSCNIYNEDDGETPFGMVHCFTCGYTSTFFDMIRDCFGQTDICFGEEWILERFKYAIVVKQETLLPIEEKEKKTNYLDISIMDKYNVYNSYIESRGVSRQAINAFMIGYDSVNKDVIFPVWDDRGNLVMLTRRNVNTKRFSIPEDVEKPVYLLNFIKQAGINKVFVCESQINALVCWSRGYPAIALFGTGTKYQYKVLKRSGILNYYLLFDGDMAGRAGAKRFMENMGDNCFITDIHMPSGKDVADTTSEQLDKIIKSNLLVEFSKISL